MFLKNQIRNLKHYTITVFDDSFLSPKTIPLIPGELYNVTYVTDNTKIEDSFKEENHILTKQTIVGKFLEYTGNSEFLRRRELESIINLDSYCTGYLKFDLSNPYQSNIISINAHLIRDIGRYIKLSNSIVITPDNFFETLVNRIESYILENMEEPLEDYPLKVNILACREIMDLITPIKHEPTLIIDRDSLKISNYSNIGIVNRLATSIREYNIMVGDSENDDSNDRIHRYSLITTDGLGVDENIDIIITNHNESNLLHLLYSISELEIVGTPFNKKSIQETIPDNNEDIEISEE